MATLKVKRSQIKKKWFLIQAAISAVVCSGYYLFCLWLGLSIGMALCLSFLHTVVFVLQLGAAIMPLIVPGYRTGDRVVYIPEDNDDDA